MEEKSIILGYCKYDILSRALGLCSAQAATLRNLDFRLTWSVVVKCCHAMIGHSEGGVKVKGCFGPSFRKGCTSHCYEVDLSTCFLSVHIGEPSTGLTNVVEAPTDDHL